MEVKVPYFAVILHTVGSGDQPLGTDDGCSTHVTIAFDLQADLPWKLPIFRIQTTDNT